MGETTAGVAVAGGCEWSRWPGSSGPDGPHRPAVCW